MDDQKLATLAILWSESDPPENNRFGGTYSGLFSTSFVFVLFYGKLAFISFTKVCLLFYSYYHFHVLGLENERGKADTFRYVGSLWLLISTETLWTFTQPPPLYAINHS